MDTRVRADAARGIGTRGPSGTIVKVTDDFATAGEDRDAERAVKRSNQGGELSAWAT
jgi:hypothetical protein